MTTLFLQPQWQAPSQPFRHSWEGLLNIDQFRHLLRSDAREHVRMGHDELGGRHVRAVGMLDDYLGTFGRDPQRYAERHSGRSNWHNAFCIIDALEELGVHPMFTTCFMPQPLARAKTPIFGGGASSAPPRDYAQWAQFITEGARLSLQRYGEDVVKNWYFEVWNEPNLGAFFNGTQQEFWELWAHTYRALKEACPELQIGGPSTARSEWLGEFLEWTRKNDCEPDYLITHIYNNDSESNPLSPFDGPQLDQQSRSPHFATGVMRGARRVADELGFKGEIHWNEWGRSWLPCDRIRESANEAAFIVKTMAEASQEADYFAYWCLSDVYDQMGFGREPFHGNYGMLSLHGLRKPSYFAHQLLGRLGTQRVGVTASGASSCVNAVATRSEGGFQILVYAFAPDVEWEPGASADSVEVRVELPAGIASPSLKLWRISESENNIVRDWEASGRPNYPSTRQVTALRDNNQLRPASEHIVLRDGCAHFTLAIPGVALLEI